MPEQLVALADGIVGGGGNDERNRHEIKNVKLKIRNEKVARLIASFVFHRCFELFQHW